LPEKRILLTMGNRLGPFGVVGVVGDANGKFDWEQRFALVTDAASRECGYPSSVTLPDGRALTLYYATKANEHPEWKVHAGAVVVRVSGRGGGSAPRAAYLTAIRGRSGTDAPDRDFDEKQSFQLNAAFPKRFANFGNEKKSCYWTLPSRRGWKRLVMRRNTTTINDWRMEGVLTEALIL
jgi:hypothetical protein